MRKCEEIAPLMILITMLKEQKYNLQQVAECEKFTGKNAIEPSLSEGSAINGRKEEQKKNGVEEVRISGVKGALFATDSELGKQSRMLDANATDLSKCNKFSFAPMVTNILPA